MSHLILSVCCLLTLSTVASAQSREADTGFRSLVSESELKSQTTAIIEAAGGISGLEQSKLPAIGQLIVEVIPQGPADQLNIQAGDVISKINDEIPWGGNFNLSGDRRSAIQRFVAMENRLQTEFVQADRLRVTVKPVWHPEQTYLRGQQRSAQYDQWMVAAALARGSHPELAESAICQALQDGYKPDTLTDQLGLEIALLQNRFDVAKQFGKRLESKYQDDETIHPLLLIKLGLATGDLGLVAKVMEFQERFPEDGNSPPVVMAMLAKMLNENQGAGEEVSYDKVANEMYRDDVTHRLRPARPLTYPKLYSQVTGEPPFVLEAPTAKVHFIPLQSSLPMPNFEINAEFEYEAVDQNVSDYLKLIQIETLAAPNATRFDSIASIGLAPRGGILLNFGNAPTELQLFDATLAQDGKQKVKVKIRRLKDVVEIYLNEHRILLAPAHDGFEDVAINLKAVGIRARFESWSVVELISKSKSEK